MKKLSKVLESSPKHYNLLKISSVSDFIARVEAKKSAQTKAGKPADLLFRGQREDMPLRPKIARLSLEDETKNRESLMIDEFKRLFLPYIEFVPENDWDVLALAQHHGLPTRLLDWTYNALAALWFTVERDPALDDEGNEKPGVVWIFAPETEDYRKFNSSESPFEVKQSKIFRPRAISRRLVSQSGVFTVHALINGKSFIALERHVKYSSKLTKIEIHPEHFRALRMELIMLGINNATLFPDLDGLCKHLSMRYSASD